MSANISTGMMHLRCQPTMAPLKDIVRRARPDMIYPT
jgi:hypothetical protein